jgi:AraC-like DNA-binding protein
MPLYQPVIPVRYVRPLLELVQSQQPADVAIILRAGGVTAAELRGDAMLTMRQFDALHLAAAATLGRTDLGFDLGDRIGRDSHDALSVVLRSCRTLDATLRMIARYWRLIIPGVRLRYVRQSGYGEYIFRPGAATSQATLHAIEETFAVGFHRDCVRLLGKPAGLQVWLSMPPPPHVARYRALTPTRFHFSASPLPEVRCVIPAALLDRPLPGATSPDTTTIDALLQAGGGGERRRQVSDWIELMLREAEGVQPTLSELADLLDVGERTLSRQLAAEGCNLRRLGSAIRYQRACALLRDSAQPIEQIGARLGYGSPAAFSTAFRNCSGTSPRTYRKAARGERASPGASRSDTL